LGNEFGQYIKNRLGDDPDEYRAGIGYVGIGPLRFGNDTEKRRDFIQNGIHDKTGVPHFKYIDRSNKWYIQFWGGGGLW
jgi:hypothetical protein